MAIFRGNGGSVEGITESDTVVIAISQGGTGATTASGARSNLGLGTAATTNSTAYATAAQGALADSAVQPGDLSTVATSGDYDDLTNKPTVPTTLDSLTDVVITSATNGQGLQFNGTNWVNSNAGSGTVTSVDMSVPTGLAVSGNPITSSGTLAVVYASGYAIPTTSKQTNWDTAYGWGDHASAGYLTSETDTGTVTSVAATVPTGFTISGTPITGSGTLALGFDTGYSLPTTASQTNWDTAYTDRLKWDGGSTGLTASTGRTSLGATTVGSNLFTLTNPSAVTFPRFNADNTVSSLTASDFRTAIGAGTGSGTVTSVGGTGTVNGLTLTGTVTSSGNLILGGTLNLSSPPAIGSTTANTGAFTTLSASGVTTFSAGSASAPALITSGDTNTGVFFPAADTVGIATGGTERVRTDSSGNLLVNRTSGLGSAKFVVEADTTSANPMTVSNSRSTASTDYSILFYRNGSIVGSVQTSLSATSYVTSSDYRLKENVLPMTGALAKVAQLKPVTYTWKLDGSAGQGFIAHELQEVVPDCVTGEKDATRIEQYEISPALPATFDEEGNELTPAVEAVIGEREVPVYQGIDTSFLVATLTAAIQELVAKSVEQQTLIEELVTRITALEAK